MRTVIPRSDSDEGSAFLARDAAKNAWTPLQDAIDQVASPRRFVVVLLGGFASFALLLAALGIYAQISYGVTQRRQEIGIRLARGASSGDVSGSIMRGTIALSLAGMLLGVADAMVVVPAMSGLLFSMTWADPVSFVGAIGLLVVVAAVAGPVPARRAVVRSRATTSLSWPS